MLGLPRDRDFPGLRLVFGPNFRDPRALLIILKHNIKHCPYSRVPSYKGQTLKYYPLFLFITYLTEY